MSLRKGTAGSERPGQAAPSVNHLPDAHPASRRLRSLGTLLWPEHFWTKWEDEAEPQDAVFGALSRERASLGQGWDGKLPGGREP